MRLFCTAPHGDEDPTVKALKDEVAYLRAQLAAADKRTEHYRDAYEHLVDQRGKHQLEFLRREMAIREANAGIPTQVPPPVPPSDNMPPWIEQNLHAGGHLEEDEGVRLPENYGRTEEELAEATIEQEAQAREDARLAAQGMTQ